jgi:type I restriction enzyme M protein
VSYGDYLEQLTYLIFLKMAEEYRKPPYSRDIGIPDKPNSPNQKYYSKPKDPNHV